MFRKFKMNHPSQELWRPSRTQTSAHHATGTELVTDGTWERKLTLEELATLQGFPDTYKFVGNKGSRLRQIGNALPPAVSRAYAGGIA